MDEDKKETSRMEIVKKAWFRNYSICRAEIYLS